MTTHSHALSTEVEDGSDYQTQRLPSRRLFIGRLLAQLCRYRFSRLLMQQLASRKLVTARFVVCFEFFQRSLPIVHYTRYECVFLATVHHAVCQ